MQRIFTCDTIIRHFIISAIASIISVFALQAAVLEEITVTAQKREQTIQDVGISVTAFTGDQLKKLGIVETRDLVAHAPGVMATGFGRVATTTFNIRGSGQNDFADQHESPVAVYVDGAYRSAMGSVGFSMFDVERAEILRGPQGNLYGRNATGGLVHIISRRPTRDFEAYADVQFGEYDLIRAEGAVSGPLSENLSGRISFLKNVLDGYVENSLGKDAYDADDTAVRGQLLFEPDAEFSLLLSLRYGKTDNGPDTFFNRPGVLNAEGLQENAPTNSSFDPAYLAFCSDINNAFFGVPFPFQAAEGQDCFGVQAFSDGIHKTASPFDGFMEREEWGVTGTVEWELSDNLRIISVSDFNDLDRNWEEDVRSTEFSDFINRQKIRKHEQFSQELRVEGTNDRLTWVLGAYFLNIDSAYNLGSVSPFLFASDTDNDYSLDTTSYAFFAQSEYRINESWAFIGGFRWTEDEKDFDATTRCIEFVAFTCDFFYGGTLQNNVTYSLSRSEGEWSGLLEIDWRPNDDWLVYAKASRGNKAGGFNGGAFFGFTIADGAEYGGEVLEALEFGFKSTFFDGKARLNASAFYYDYSDFQSFTLIGTTFVIGNVNAEVFGTDIELTLNPWDGWDVLLGFSALDATQENVPFAGLLPGFVPGPVISRDRPMPNAPDWTFNGMVRYEWPSFFGGVSNIQFELEHVDDRSFGGIDHPAVLDGGYTVVDASIGWTSSDERWDLSLWVRNLNDEEYFLNGFQTSDVWSHNGFIPAPPRWVGGSIGFNWE